LREPSESAVIITFVLGKWVSLNLTIDSARRLTLEDPKELGISGCFVNQNSSSVDVFEI
jgi:hypothetical protein